jgi:hypothetical protein
MPTMPINIKQKPKLAEVLPEFNDELIPEAEDDNFMDDRENITSLQRRYRKPYKEAGSRKDS